ncbi:MAG: CopG family transcriptional regulator [Halorhabdus sp.]
MPTRFAVVLDDDRSQEIEALARQYGLTEEEVLRQLLDLGLDALEVERATQGGMARNTDS